MRYVPSITVTGPVDPVPPAVVILGICSVVERLVGPYMPYPKYSSSPTVFWIMVMVPSAACTEKAPHKKTSAALQKITVLETQKFSMFSHFITQKRMSIVWISLFSHRNRSFHFRMQFAVVVIGSGFHECIAVG